jgi:hypothetical protein
MEFLFAAMERPESAQIDENASLDGDESTTTESDATIDTAEASLEMSAANSLAFLRAPTGHLKGVRELSDGRFKAWGARDVPLGVFDDASTAALAVSRYVEQKKRSRPLQAWGAARPTVVDDDDESPPKQMRPGDFFWTPEESETLMRLLRTMPAADALRKWEVVAAHLPGRTPTGARNHFKRLRERDAKLAAQTALVVHSPVALECHERLDAAAALRVEVEGDADGDVAPWSAEELASADWEAQDAVGYDGRSPEEAAALALLSPTAGSAAAGPSPPTSARRPGPAPQRFYPGPPGSAAPTPPAEAFYPPARASARAPKPTEAARQSKDTGPTSHLVGDGPTYMCLFDGCGKMYSSTDSARKHCRQRHTAWLRSRDQRLGTRAYCMPIGEHTWTDGERYL